MQLGRNIDLTSTLKRERDEARGERDAGRLVIASLTDDLAAALRQRAEDNVASYVRIEALTAERDRAVEEYAEADASHRALLADLGEAHRQLAALNGDDVDEEVLRQEPDMERYG